MSAFDAIPRSRTALATLAAGAMLGAGFVAHQATALERPDLPDYGVVQGEDHFTDGRTHVVVETDDAGVAALRAADRTAQVDLVAGSSYQVVTKLSRRRVAELTGATPQDDLAAPLAGTAWGSGEYDRWQWGLENWGGPVGNGTGTAKADVAYSAAAAAGVTGAGVVVAVVDSGTDPNHPELRDAMWRNTDENCTNRVDDDGNGYVDDCDGWDFANGDNTPFDTATAHFHGTHVASIVAGQGTKAHGVAPGARIMNLKVGNGSSVSVLGGARAIYYAVDNGARVINCSWGGANPSSAVRQLLSDAVAYAEARGVVVVTAAGNSSLDIDRTEVVPAGLPNPGLVTVAASGGNDDLASFSNYSGSQVDLAAPGVSILAGVLDGGYGYASGTSMASPMVAGAAALLMGQNPSLDTAQVRSRLMATVDRGTAFEGTTLAEGRLNVAKALGLPDPHTADVAPAAPLEPGRSSTTFTGFSGLTDARPAAATVEFHPGSAEVGDSYSLEGELYAFDGEDTYVVQGQSLDVDGRSVTTDDAGRFSLVGVTPAAALADGTNLALSLALPPGDYALAVSMIDGTDSTRVLDRPAAVYFDVADDPSAGPGTDPGTPGTTPGDGSPTTSTPTGGGTGGGSTPTTTPPGSGSPTSPTPTTAPGTPGGGSGGAGGGTGGGTATTTVPPATGGAAPTTTAPRSATTTTTPSGTIPTPTFPPPTSTPRTPTTTAPASSPTTTAAPAAPRSSSPTTTVPPAAPVTDGSWRITGASPNACAVRTACWVTISGSFPADVSVWFGSAVVPASSVTRTSTQLRLQTPSVAYAGTVDLTLRGRDASGDVSVTQPGGFTFTDPTGTAPRATTTTVPAPSGGGSTTPTTTPGGSGGSGSGPTPTTTPATPTTAPSTPGAPGSPTTTVPPRGTARAELQLGLPRVRANGLRTARVISGGHVVSRSGFSASRCRDDRCPGIAV